MPPSPKIKEKLLIILKALHIVGLKCAAYKQCLSTLKVVHGVGIDSRKARQYKHVTKPITSLLLCYSNQVESYGSVFP